MHHTTSGDRLSRVGAVRLQLLTMSYVKNVRRAFLLHLAEVNDTKCVPGRTGSVRLWLDKHYSQLCYPSHLL